MIDKVESIECGTKKTVPLVGKTTIELRDAKTGELVYQKVDHNMVTNFFQGPFSHEICGTYSNQLTDYFAAIQGVQLISVEKAEDPTDVDLEILGSQVTGFGNLTVNSAQTNTKWMSYNLLESGRTQKGFKWVWDANVNQCNGPIACVSLITNDMSKDAYTSSEPASTSSPIKFTRAYQTSSMPMYIGKWVDDTGNASNLVHKTGEFSNIVHIDWEQDIMYDIERNYDDDKKIIIKKYAMNRDKIHLRYKLKPTLIEEHEITFQNSLNHDYVSGSTTRARPFGVKVEGNIMYMIKGGESTFTANTNKLRVIKINLTDYTYTDEVKTLTVTFMDCYQPQISNQSKSRNFHFVKDYYPIVDGYVYLSDTATVSPMRPFKIKIDDVSDVTIIKAGYSSSSPPRSTYMYPNIVTRQNIFFGQRVSGNGAYTACLTLNNNWMAHSSVTMDNRMPDSATGFYGSSTKGYTRDSYNFVDVHEGVMTLCGWTPTDETNSNRYSGMVYIEQLTTGSAKVTINNITPVTKTSDKTMRVIYELNEVDA